MTVTAETMTEATTTELARPEHITRLRTAAIQVCAKVTSTTGSKTDRGEGADLAQRRHAESNTVDVVKKLFARCPEHRELQNVRQTVNNGMKRFTYDWAGDWRILPMTRYADFMAWWQTMLGLHAERKKAFIEAYPSVRADAAFSLGDLFREEDFPPVEHVASKFTITLFQSDIPEGDFRNQIAADLADDLHKHYVMQANELVQSIVDEQMEQVVGVMQSLVHCCGYDTKENKKGDIIMVRRKLHEGTLQRALELIDTTRKFNPGASTLLESVRAELEDVLRGVDDIDKLRTSEAMRARVSTEVGGILNKFRLGGVETTERA